MTLDDRSDPRLTRAERDIMELTREIGLYRNEVLQWRLDLARDYVPRREFEGHQALMKDQFREISEKSDSGATRMWLAISTIGTVISATSAAAAWLHSLGR